MRNLKLLLCAMFTLALTSSAFAQDTPFDDLPPTNEYGKCYAKCKVPDQYEYVELQKVKKEASTRLEKVPAVYETVTEQVLAKEGAVKYKVIPATFKTVSEKMMIEPEKRKLRTIPAKYTTQTRQVLETPERGQWVRKKKSPNCFSQNPDDCYVACYEKIPAKYRTETFQVLASAATTTEDIIPAKYKTVTKKVVDQPARVEEIPVEAVYKTITKKVLVSPEATREITIPAVYTTIKEKRLVKEGGYTVWTEVLCAEKTTSNKVMQVQKALKGMGYNPGPIDGVMGVQTQTALRQFQTDKSLPLGNLNMETLKALDVNQ
ncbi:MAG: peptidoglycan-binding protein [Saprospiraceae bacterium]